MLPLSDPSGVGGLGADALALSTELRVIAPSGGDWPAARLYHASCVVRDTHVYVFGGAPKNGNTTAADVIFDDFWAYSTLTEKWRRVMPPAAEKEAPWPSRRGSCELHFVDPYVYIVGGFNGAGAVYDAWRFDVDTEQWQPLAIPEELVAGGHGFWAYASCLRWGSPSGGGAPGPFIEFAGGIRGTPESGETNTRMALAVPRALGGLRVAVVAYVRRHAGCFRADELRAVAASSASPRRGWWRQWADALGVAAARDGGGSKI